MTIQDLVKIRVIFNNSLEELSKTQSKTAWRILSSELSKIYYEIEKEVTWKFRKDVLNNIYGECIYSDTDAVEESNMNKYYDFDKLKAYLDKPMYFVIQKRRKRK